MLSFHSDQKIKDEYVNRVKLHAERDEIMQGKYWEKGKGCAVGCTIHGSEHYKYEIELGIPMVLVRLEDEIFEGLSNDEAKKFPLRFLESIPVGVNLDMVWPKFVVWLLGDETYGVVRFNKDPAILNVITLYQQKIDGTDVSKDKWIEAHEKVNDARRRFYSTATVDAYFDAAAYSAAAAVDAYFDAAAYSAAAAAAHSAAAYSAAAAAAYSAAAAADAAAYSAAADADAAHYKLMADKLCEILVSKALEQE